MALKLPTPPPLTIFSPQTPSTRTSTIELRFSRWNNANAEKFNQKQRAQQEIEDDIRRERRFSSATKITENHEIDTTISDNENFKSIGTPSSPSRSSIPGKKSKYSKTPYSNPKISHPAFSKSFQARKYSVSKAQDGPPSGVEISESGVSYRVPNAPFEFQYSYTETPKMKPLALREPPFVPFGPTTMPRPWTGRAPLPPSKKKLPEFDSFKLPPPHKKGVKPVQSPGPFLAGMGPKYAQSREEVLGDPLTEEEIKDLIESCLKTRRQLNMGRDGLTHNMLDNIHAHWKRRRVCKIKCKGVCTVDMDNVREQLEEKTGGKIIYSRGGVLFLFRGRNYNYKTRPRFPLMLWKPVSPVYPRLIQQTPEGLTLEEAKEMRKKGRGLQPICKLGKNGVYAGLVKHVKEAFEECELVRIDCKGMNGSDYKKIGAKLKDLVPCILISFEYEHILIWRGPDWKSSPNKSTITDIVEQEEALKLLSQDGSDDDEDDDETVLESPDLSSSSPDNKDLNLDPMDEPQASSTKPVSPFVEEIIQLQKKAVEDGTAIVLEDTTNLDADIVYQTSVTFAKSAPRGPVFRNLVRKVLVRKRVKNIDDNELVEEISFSENTIEKKSFRNQKSKDFIGFSTPDVLPYGSLGVDELAKLLG